MGLDPRLREDDVLGKGPAVKPVLILAGPEYNLTGRALSGLIKYTHNPSSPSVVVGDPGHFQSARFPITTSSLHMMQPLGMTWIVGITS